MITLEDQIEEVRREVERRRRTYPGLVASDQMMQVSADKGIAAMLEVLRTLEFVHSWEVY